jgi:molybdopterin-guanine dinucleotide biosynthesis protein A
MSKPLGVILAGGLATRMGGGDKGRLELLNGQSVLDFVIHTLGLQVDAMALNANGEAARFADLGLPVIADTIQGFAGPLAGVLAGLDWAAAQGAETIVTVAADTPFFPATLVADLCTTAQGQDHPLVLAATRDEYTSKIFRHPTFGLWPVALRDDLRGALQDGLRKVVLWTDRHDGRQHVFETGGIDPFFNVNTPQDLEIARDWAKGE